jgi:hypothetical protein
LRIHADTRKTWTWTASQMVRRGKGDKKRVADIDDGADSQGKVRVADLVITLNPREDATLMEWFVPKFRLGRSMTRVGPLPVDFAHGSMVMRAQDTPQDQLWEPGEPGSAG